jgi:hypothetical protein
MDIKLDLEFTKLVEFCCPECKKKIMDYAKNNAKINLTDDDILNAGGKK